MNASPNNDIALLHEPVLALFEEDRARMHGNYGYSMESVFGTQESEAEAIGKACLSETDPGRIAQLYSQLCGLLFRSPAQSHVIESADSLVRVHEILDIMGARLKAAGIDTAEEQIATMLTFIGDKHRLLMEYHATNL